jgi:hypothetical protein
MQMSFAIELKPKNLAEDVFPADEARFPPLETAIVAIQNPKTTAEVVVP